MRKRSESRWPPIFAVIAATILYALLPPHLTLGPRWLMPVLVAALAIPLAVAGPILSGRDVSRLLRTLGIALIALVNLANIASLVLLVRALVTGVPKESGIGLLYSAAAIWFVNILVFGLWYWEADRGGPQLRLNASKRSADFMFPQMLSPSCAPTGWMPMFADYLYLAFTNATAFSPTDTMPLTTLAKTLMTIQALISLLTIVLVAARAVNIIA
ncbi:MAG: hypothetical protein JO194_10305 [Candidatus Eremiobacteraeota bacterium]|nr:hypothetical protein [Candidatus Eremiobacteraeota bacterium]